MSSLNGKLVIVTSSPGYRDSIYVGYVEREGDLLVLSKSSMILRYETVGICGVASQPEFATSIRPVTSSNGRVWVPLSSVSTLIEADEDAWKEHLGVSR